MNTDWETAIAFVLKMEGGETVENNPDDPGGETKFGISKKAYPSIDIANLTLEQAKEIYHRDYWIPCSGDDLPTAFAIGVFDAAVNQGVTKAKRFLQMALGMDVIDGIIGPKTLAAAAKATPYLVKKFLAERLAEYSRIIVSNPRLIVFAFDWSYRVISLADLILVKP